MTLDDIPEDLMISMSDVKDAGFCAAGTRRWFQAHGLDFRQFLVNGMTAREMFSINDAAGIRVVTMKIEREQPSG